MQLKVRGGSTARSAGTAAPNVHLQLKVRGTVDSNGQVQLSVLDGKLFGN